MLDSLKKVDLGAIYQNGKWDYTQAHINVKERYSKMLTPWYKYFYSFEPRVVLKNVQCPLLALNGTKDVVVLSELNLKGFREMKKAGIKTNIDIVEFPGLNHFFQPCITGSYDEVEEIETTISEKVLKTMGDWILQEVEG